MGEENRQLRIGVFPGSFDPVTTGHMDLIRRAMKLVDVLYIAVLNNCNKQSAFSVEQRVQMIEAALAEYGFSGRDIRVEGFDGMLVDYAAKRECTMIIRGLRSARDFEYELLIDQMNKRLAPGVETCFMATLPEYSYISSSAVKEVAMYGRSIHGMVPACIEQMVMKAVCF